MSLTEELEAQLATSLKNAPALAHVVDRVLADLRAQQTGDAAPGPGEWAPDFALPSARGGSVRLSERLARGPVVLTFYRGGWCPYCNIELRAYQRELARIEALGASLIAISPQTPDASLTTAEKNALSFDVLSDVGSTVAQQYGLAFALPEYLREVYRERNILLPQYNGSEDWMLPIPATFAIARDGRVALASVDVEYRTRLDPEAVIASLESLAAQG